MQTSMEIQIQTIVNQQITLGTVDTMSIKLARSVQGIHVHTRCLMLKTWTN